MTETLVHDPASRPPVPQTPATWAEEIDERLVCTRIDDVTHDVRSFVLARPGRAALTFDPGQHLTVTVEVDGEEVQRCYTIASPPTRSDLLTITVKRVPGGPVSNWLHDRLAVGDTVRAAGPYGRFSLASHPASKYLFLSAGSGITPVMSMTRTLHDRGEPTDLVFVHSARTPYDIIFRRELDTIAARPGVSVTAICEADPSAETWGGETGRLTLRTLLRLAPDLHDREVFTCGPPGYMESVRGILELAGVDPARCHEESFELGTRASAPARQGRRSTPSAQRYAVEFRRSGCSVECEADESILDAALRAGLSPPSMCTEGMCGTCKSTLLEGDVDMRHAGGIRPKEIDLGQILICCSKPLGDLVVDA